MRLILAFLFIFQTFYGCTDFVLEAADGTFVNGRSLEFAVELPTELRVFPRNQSLQSQSSDRKKGVSWVSKYGFLGATCLGKNLVMDGLNEKGLSMGFLWLPGTEYQKVPADKSSHALDFVDLGMWILGQFSKVSEVKQALKDIYVWGHPVPPLPGIPPIHVAIHDAEGNHLVIEFIKGKALVYDNPNTVLTNYPQFDWQLINLQNYVNLTALNSESIKLKGRTISPTGEGSGLLGLPGDWTPPSRFVKISTLLRFIKQPENGLKGVNLAEHLLNSVDIPKGDIRDGNSDRGDYTQWIVIKDLKDRVFYFRSYNDLGLKMIDLKKLNFERGLPGKSVSMDAENGYLDMTDSFKAITGSAFKK